MAEPGRGHVGPGVRLVDVVTRTAPAEASVIAAAFGRNDGCSAGVYNQTRWIRKHCGTDVGTWMAEARNAAERALALEASRS